ncbi:polyphosphate kinase 1 [Anaerotardibacter muris]|uniref:polyphosphate kinase 1 n=1 Tax=Anaerotardibacter muris TaxID=2941505 RepID=UPI002041A429|nr:polyphosphate kinase 1 [Anaerotardibacter muris]
MVAKKDNSSAQSSKSSDASNTETKGKKTQVKNDSSKKKLERLPYMQNRELSWLNFNKRVLDQGEDQNVPLLERLTFVSIFSSNLQEFFMVRVGSLTDLSLIKKEIRDNKTLMTPEEQLNAIYQRCHELYPDQERIFMNIQDQLAEYGIRNLQVKDLSDEQREWLHGYLEDQVVPYLSPQIINARHPFPHFENGKLYILLRLNEELPKSSSDDSDSKSKKKPKNLGAEDATFGLIPLPRQAKRLILLPGEGTQFILLENALKLIVDEVFSMYSTKRASVICVTRNADIDPNTDIDEIDYDYREHMKRILKKRARLTPVRLETDTALSSVTEQFLLPRLDITQDQVFVTNVPLDMSYAWSLPDLVDPETAAKLTNDPFSPAWPACLDRNQSIMQQVIEHDKLLSYPYQSMDPFINLLREAANDPSVLSIKITLYRLASQSHLAEALLAAAENGKEVTALFELRARFDESNNIEWSQRFEQAGAHVIYGFRDYKVHSKICVITRMTDNGLQRITQLGTGNYNEKTSKLYTDFSFMTADPRIGQDAAEFFKNMSLENISTNYSTLSVAPLQIKPMILEKIDEQIARANAGLPNGLVFKTNSITDKDTIDKIVEASQAGVHTTLFVRGISCIVPGIKGYTENVEVVSIVGRLLEHSRIYGFGVQEDMEIYLSSADLMTRNMDKRVEIAWPIFNQELKDIVLNYLDVSLSDTAKLRMLENNLEYTPLGYFSEETASGKIESFDSQAFLIHKAEVDYEESALLNEEEAISRAARSHVNHIISAPVSTVREDAVGNAKESISLEVPYSVPLEEGEPGVVTNFASEADDHTKAQDASDGARTASDAPVIRDIDHVVVSLDDEVDLMKSTEGEPLNNTPVAEAHAASGIAPEEVVLNIGSKVASEAPEDAELSFNAPIAKSEEAITAGSAAEAETNAGEADESKGETTAETAVESEVPAPEVEVIEQEKDAATVIEPEDIEMLPREEPAQKVEIQLIEQFPKKPNFWKRLKFLFTGHF